MFIGRHFGLAFGTKKAAPTVSPWSAEAMWLFVAWGYWVDRHRTAT